MFLSIVIIWTILIAGLKSSQYNLYVYYLTWETLKKKDIKANLVIEKNEYKKIRIIQYGAVTR